MGNGAPRSDEAFLADWANWQGLRRVVLTFDVDFAPEYMIENVLGLLGEFGASATFFATHDSDLLRREAKRGVHEVGIHPNLTPGSTQPGASDGISAVAPALADAYDDVVGCRFHVLGYSYRDLVALGQLGYRYDVSTLRFNCSHLQPAWHPDVGMTLLTYSWEDGICENAELPIELSSVALDSPGMKVLNFHPLNVWVNGTTAAQRLALLGEQSDLLACPRSVAERHRHAGAGTGTLLRDLLADLRRRDAQTARLRDLVDAFEVPAR